MERIKLNIKKENGVYPLPDNLVNRDMFSYPSSILKRSNYKYASAMKCKINAIVCYYGLYYGDNIWSIITMSDDYILICDSDGVETRCGFGYFYYNNFTLYMFSDMIDQYNFYQNILMYNRLDKIEYLKEKIDEQ